MKGQRRSAPARRIVHLTPAQLDKINATLNNLHPVYRYAAELRIGDKLQLHGQTTITDQRLEDILRSVVIGVAHEEGLL